MVCFSFVPSGTDQLSRRMKKSIGKCICFLLLAGVVRAQSPDVLKIRNYRQQHEISIIDGLVSLLRIPNVAADRQQLHANADTIMLRLQQLGMTTKLLRATDAEVPPAVFAEWKVPGATRTLLFYAHYDGQPVNPAQWYPGLAPFDPQLVKGVMGQGGVIAPFLTEGSYDPNWRIYARGSSDDKGGVTAIIEAWKAILALQLPLHANIKFLFEGEEEAGSPHLSSILEQNAGLLQADLCIICDGPVHQSGKKQIVFGVRGDAHLELTVYASKRPLHSGHYGNWAPNPALMLAQLLASMKDEHGRVTIPHFYSDVTPLSAAEKKAIRAVPSVEENLKEELGIRTTEYEGLSLPEAISLPSLNINGMQSGNVGKLASNVIPTTATAVLDLRLVPGNDWQRQQQRVIDYIKARGYYVTENDPTDAERKKYSRIIKVSRGTDGYNAQRTPMDLPAAREVIEAVQQTVTDPLVLLPTMGGSLPLEMMERQLKTKIITVPIANHDNNQHAENENIRLHNLWAGIETMAAIMLMK